ncbi:hypothetical protein AMS68_001372 [Peltaster fructicola]|uniref:Uncharacterized protein n=1 Tax=Peltaster fructicola TaxID=286661 RepID=A0A6H0XMJ6_9PEZI|nr:hypothetical protein AMS68_001372 [Peltaster fructicola]
MTSLITATAWVPRGHAAAYPTKYVFDEDEYARISKLAKLELDDAREDLEAARNALSGDAESEKQAEEEDDEDGGIELDPVEEDDDLKEYDMDHYDDDEENEEDEDEDGTAGIVGNIKSLAYHNDNSEDPYITIPENADSDDEERDELQILPTDNLLLAARIEDEVAHLEAYVYEDAQDNLYVHHDVMLPAIPLCVEWVSARPNQADQAGNFAAVGTMEPDIELWDLDVVDSMYPTVVLGQNTQELPTSVDDLKKKKKRKAHKANETYHVDAVLSLAANRHNANLLGSASADQTVKLWDLNSCKCAQSYSHHTDKVCTIAWHPRQASVLLSGSYDRTIVAADMRAPAAKVPRWGVESDVEQVKWDPLVEHTFYVSTEQGVLHCFDTRKLPTSPEQSKPTWRLQAHEKSLSSFTLNPVVPGMFATGGQDRVVKIWSVVEGQGPSMIVSRDLGVGKVFSTNFAPDEAIAFRLAVAGSKGAVQVWDTSTNRAVRDAFATRVRLPEVAADGKERMIVLAKDDEAEDEEDEEDEQTQADGDIGETGQDGWESMEED